MSVMMELVVVFNYLGGWWGIHRLSMDSENCPRPQRFFSASASKVCRRLKSLSFTCALLLLLRATNLKLRIYIVVAVLIVIIMMLRTVFCLLLIYLIIELFILLFNLYSIV